MPRASGTTVHSACLKSLKIVSLNHLDTLAWPTSSIVTSRCAAWTRVTASSTGCTRLYAVSGSPFIENWRSTCRPLAEVTGGRAPLTWPVASHGGQHGAGRGSHRRLVRRRAGAGDHHQFGRGILDARVDQRPGGLAGLADTVLGLGHGDLADRAAEQHGHDDERQPGADRGQPVPGAPPAERGGEIGQAAPRRRARRICRIGRRRCSSVLTSASRLAVTLSMAMAGGGATRP